MVQVAAAVATVVRAACQLLVELARVRVLAADKMDNMGVSSQRVYLSRSRPPLCQVLLYHLL